MKRQKKPITNVSAKELPAPVVVAGKIAGLNERQKQIRSRCDKLDAEKSELVHEWNANDRRKLELMREFDGVVRE